MKIPVKLLRKWAERLISRREPDFIIGGKDDPYLRRWYILPRNMIFNIYLHEMLRSDDDRALHDHPWWWCSVMLRGSYWEQHDSTYTEYKTGSIRIRRATWAHRLVLNTHSNPLTFFITGPKIREWGFHCPQGWRHWKEFTNPIDTGAVGRGCQ